jgi:hypothetical protein
MSSAMTRMMISSTGPGIGMVEGPFERFDRGG